MILFSQTRQLSSCNLEIYLLIYAEFRILQTIVAQDFRLYGLRISTELGLQSLCRQK